MGDSKAALMAQIAALSGAISQHKAASNPSTSASTPSSTTNHPQSSHAYHPSSFYPSSSTFRGRGRGTSIPRGSARGSARGSLRGSARGGAIGGHNKSLVITPKAQPASETGEEGGNNNSGDSWVKTNSHNMSLMSSDTYQKTEPARQAAIARTAQIKAASSSRGGRGGTRTSRGSKTAPKSTTSSSSSSSLRRGENMGEVVIDGVVFVFDKAGDKLVKKKTQPEPSSSDPTSTPNSKDVSSNLDGNSPSTPTNSTPLRTTIDGESFIRTKGGNLVKAEVAAQWKANRELRKKREEMEELKKKKLERLSQLGKQVGERQKARYASTSNKKPRRGNMSLNAAAKGKLCPYFTKTGQCKRRLSCPYKHDSSRVAICPGILRPTGCTRAVGTCMLSHASVPENTPHCVHFLRFQSCRLGDNCLYSKGHISGITSNDRICRDFNLLGWCEKGKNCKERHTWECKDFNELGKCERAGCKLLHVEQNKGGNAGANRGSGSEANFDSSIQGDGASSLNISDGTGLQDGDLFMRDDAAEQESEEENADDEEEDEDEDEDEDGDGSENDEEDQDQDQDLDNQEVTSKKRKRGLLESGAFSKITDDRGLPLSFATKKKKAKEFTGQDDFVRFDDDEEEEEEEEEGEGDGDDGHLGIASDEESIASEAEEQEEVDDEEEQEDPPDEQDENEDENSM